MNSAVSSEVIEVVVVVVTVVVVVVIAAAAVAVVVIASAVVVGNVEDVVANGSLKSVVKPFFSEKFLKQIVFGI